MTGLSSENEEGGGRWKCDGQKLVVRRGPDFQDDIGDYRRDEEMGR